MREPVRFISPLIRTAVVLGGLALGGWYSFAQEASPPPRRQIVADVKVSGNRRVATQNIISQLKTRPGVEYNPDTIQEDVRTLIATNQYGNVQARFLERPDGRVDIYFVIVDFPNVVEEVLFEGAHSIKKKDLEDMTNVKKGKPLNPVQNQIACQTIVRAFNDKGRPFASCTLAEGGKPGDSRVVFNITEGPQVFVRDIKFSGNKFVSGPVLRTHLMSSRWILGIHAVSKPYIAAMTEADVDKLRDYYRSFGFHDVRVSREVKWSDDSKTVVLIFHINEGQRYRIKGAPEIVGQYTVPKEEVNRVIQVKADENYSQTKIDTDVSRIRDYIGFTGKLATVEDRLFWTNNGECVVQYEVRERPPARVGQIFIVGNTTTRQNVILRQVPLYPGQPLSYPAIREAERNLARINLFESDPEKGDRPTVTVLDQDSDSPFKDILINLKETRTGSLLFGVGFNSDAGATGSIVLNERNFDITRLPTSFEDLLSGQAFRGAGQEMRIEAVPGTELQRYTFQFREPYLFDSKYSLSVGGYYYTRFFNEYKESRLGSRVTVGRRLNDYWTANGTVRVENIGVNDVPFFAPQDYLDARGNNFLTSLRVGLTRDSRDSYLRPTQGSQLDIAVEQATGENTFPIATVDFNQYYTVWQRADGSGRHVVALRSNVSVAGDDTPVYERFYAGGFRSIRGFAFRGVGPQVNGFKVGGEFQLLNSVEYQVPVTAGDSVYVVGFVDSGTVESKVEIKDYRVSAGFGLRFVVPMLGPVPIALDFGFPIVKGQFDQEQMFSFWLGFFR